MLKKTVITGNKNTKCYTAKKTLKTMQRLCIRTEGKCKSATTKTQDLSPGVIVWVTQSKMGTNKQNTN